MIEQRRVLMLYRTFGPSVYLCGLIQLEWLAERDRVQFRHMSILHVTSEDLDWAEIVVFVRGDGLLDQKLAELCKRHGRHVVYVLDDDLLRVPNYLGSGPYYGQKSVQSHILSLLNCCDSFLSPSEKLISIYGADKQSFLIVEPSSYREEQKAPNKDGKVHIGFAGSSDRGIDVDEILSDALKIVSDRYAERIQVEFFGPETKLARDLKCTTYPYTESYEAYQEQMAQLNWDIGLAPMPDTHFHSCKHYNKLVEYCGFGIVGVYSNVLPYTLGVEDGVTGILCDNNVDSWVEAIGSLITDEGLRANMAKNCLANAAGRFSVRTSAERLMDAINQMPQCIEPKQIQSSLLWIKVVGTMSWYFEKYKKYGWRTPVIAAKKAMKLLNLKH